MRPRFHKLISQGIDEHPAHRYVVMVTPSPRHPPQLYKVSIGGLVPRLKRTHFALRIACLPRTPAIRVSEGIAAVIVQKCRQNFVCDFVSEFDYNDLAIA